MWNFHRNTLCTPTAVRYFIGMTKNALRIGNTIGVSGTPSPFLKWAGGKTRLLNVLRGALPQGFSDDGKWIYVEPFCGAGALFFSIVRDCNFRGRAVLSDINPALIGAWSCVQKTPEKLVAALRVIENDFFATPESARRDFFAARRKEFNEEKSGTLRSAALLIFLNKTCFNGLFRVNSRGEFNVPFGRYKRPKICAAETIFADAAVLKNAEIICGDFEKTFTVAKKFRARGNRFFFYFDPPYKPLSATSSFTAYAREKFGDEAQIRLRDFCKTLDAAGILWLLSNSDADDDNAESFFDKLYAGFNIRRIRASRAISADGTRRANVSEVLISNY